MRSLYDALRRPIHSYARLGAIEKLVSGNIYGESLLPVDALTGNLRGRIYQVFDSAGVVVSVRFDSTQGQFDFTTGFDFKGNSLGMSRRLHANYRDTPDWGALASLDGTAALAAVAGQLEMEWYVAVSTYDALNRITSHTTPDGGITRHVYNRANLLDSVSVQQGTTTTQVITNIDYNAKGQRILCAYGERTIGTTSDPAYTVTYEYEPQTFRLTHLLSAQASSGRKLQDLSYVYDPVGNIVRIGDDANWNVILQTEPVDGHGLYEYDPIYRLTGAEGREHPGQQGTYGDSDALGGHIPHANDTSALARYFEEYVYDEVGNIQSLHHGLVNPNPPFPDWTRTYAYATNSNRLLSTAEPIGVTPATATYGYDGTNGAGGAHGSMTSMGHLSLIEWDYADRMQHVVRGTGGGEVYFNYDSSGQRVRKVYEHGSYIEQRIYLGGYEIYRRTNSGTLDVHRQTLHVMDDQRRVAMVETTLADTDSAMLGTRWRFQLDNHLGSAALETDAQGRVISYEEYHPYGTTAFRLAEDDAHVPAKRYRYTGKERDEETSLYYHGARYYAPWLGRWTAADPIGTADGVNLYSYSHGSPVDLNDPAGTQTTSAEQYPTARQMAGELLGMCMSPQEVQDISYKVGETTVKAYLIPGKSEEKALVYGGIHAKERAGKEVAEITLERLRNAAEAPDFTTIIIPDVFGGKDRTVNGRELRQGKHKLDPNKSFPDASEKWGRRLDEVPVDSEGQPLDARPLSKKSPGPQPIPPEIQALIRIREKYDPTRIIQLHGIEVTARKPNKPGIYSDARPGMETVDRELAKKMALDVGTDAPLPGNDPKNAKDRDPFEYPTKGVARQEGVSGGYYFSRPSKDGTLRAANVILIETHNNERSDERKRPNEARRKQLNAFARAITNVFLKQ